MKNVEDVIIEKIVFDDNGNITALDIHDEDKGDAVFLEVKDRHFHGHYKKGIYERQTN